MNQDLEIYKFIDNKVMTTIGEEQKEWVRKYDVFTSRFLFEKYHQVEYLKEVDKIRKEILNLLR